MKPTALHIYHIPTSFTKIDNKILSERFTVIDFAFTISSWWSIPILWIKQKIFLLKHIRKSKLIFCMFAGYHTIVPVIFAKIFKKPCIIVAGGIDSVAFPSVNYGNFTKYILGKITAWSFKLCTHIAPISDYLVDSAYTYQDNDFPRQGFRYHVPQLKTPHTTIYNGFELKNWFSDGNKRTPNTFLTIASNLDNMARVNIKGVDLILQVATLLPQFNFTIIGRDANFDALKPTVNVKIIPFVAYHELRKIYCAHQFYLQLSMSEGFGNTLSEAMLCGCIPIGSNAGAIPFIIADAGFVLKRKDKFELQNLLIAASNDENKIAIADNARKRILDNFSIEKRGEAMIKLIDKIT